MKTNKILLVTHGFYPEISPRSFRATELAIQFAKLGHEVSVIAEHRDFDYSQFLANYPINLKLLPKNKFVPISIKSKEPLKFISRAILRTLMWLFEYPHIEVMFKIKKKLKHENNYTLLISFAMPHPVHWGVAWSRNRKHRIADTWIADCGDPYMLGKLDTFKKPFYFKYFEITFCKKCDFITVPFEQMKKQFYDSFNRKIRVIPQGFNFEEIKISKDKVNNQIPVFIFAGSIIPGKRDLNSLVSFLSKQETSFRFKIFTNNKDIAIKYALCLGEKLLICDYIDRLKLIFEMSKADFLINIDTIYDDSNNTEAVPSKLIDYALSGRPILSINSKCFDEQLVIQFLNGNYQGSRVIDTSKYDIRKVAAQFIDLSN